MRKTELAEVSLGLATVMMQRRDGGRREGGGCELTPWMSASPTGWLVMNLESAVTELGGRPAQNQAKQKLNVVPKMKHRIIHCSLVVKTDCHNHPPNNLSHELILPRSNS